MINTRNRKAREGMDTVVWKQVITESSKGIIVLKHGGKEKGPCGVWNGREERWGVLGDWCRGGSGGTCGSLQALALL